MKKINLIVAAASIVLSAGAYAQDCVDTEPPAELADGATATIEELGATQAEVKAYMAASNVFLECLEKQQSAAIESGTETEETMAVRNEQYNAEVDQQTAIAADWKEQVGEYKARTQ
ncbi:MAG: hypothetical protein V7711_00775 [Pseudomonadales bacterium]